MEEQEVKKPKLKLVGEDGNAMMIIGAASRAARAAGWSKEQIDAYRKEAMSSNYDHLLAVTMQRFNVS